MKVLLHSLQLNFPPSEAAASGAMVEDTGADTEDTTEVEVATLEEVIETTEWEPNRVKKN